MSIYRVAFCTGLSSAEMLNTYLVLSFRATNSGEKLTHKLKLLLKFKLFFVILDIAFTFFVCQTFAGCKQLIGREI
jgi:hypothetical protein